MHADLTDASVHVPAEVLTPPRSQTVAENAADALVVPNPTYDEIAERALELCSRRRGANGQDLQDWVNAERQLRFERRRTAALD